MQSNVGNSQVYNDGDQKNTPKAEIEQEKKDARFHEGQIHAHKANDSSMFILEWRLKNQITDLFCRGRTNYRQQAGARREGQSLAYVVNGECTGYWLTQDAAREGGRGGHTRGRCSKEGSHCTCKLEKSIAFYLPHLDLEKISSSAISISWQASTLVESHY